MPSPQQKSSTQDPSSNLHIYKNQPHKQHILILIKAMSHKPSSPEAPVPQPIEAGEASSQAQRYQEDTKKWGTYLMGQPCAPTDHPDNQKAATWKAGGRIHPLIGKPTTTINPFQPLIRMFNSWSKKADNNTAMFKQNFNTSRKEKLKKSFACYLSTTTGPVAGTLFLSTARVAFLSDRHLCHRDRRTGGQALSYYKDWIPLEKVGTINPVIKRENEVEKYIEIVSFFDGGRELWFMGFADFEEALKHLLNTLSEFRAAGNLGYPIVAAAAGTGAVKPSQ